MAKIELTIADKKERYHLPDGWDEINVRQYQQLAKVLEVQDASEIEIKVSTIAALTELTEAKIGKIKLSDIDEVYNYLVNLPAINEELYLIIEVDGVEYGFNPDLKNITTAEFTDIDTYLQAGVSDNLHKVLPILYRPVVDYKNGKYRIEEYDYQKAIERAELFRDNVSINTVNGAAVFFYALGQEYQQIILHSLEVQAKMEKKKIMREMRSMA